MSTIFTEISTEAKNWLPRQDIEYLLQVVDAMERQGSGAVLGDESARKAAIEDIRSRWSLKPKRETGYYWVRRPYGPMRNGDWQPAKWDEKLGSWRLIGSFDCYSDSAFMDIGPALSLVLK